MGEKKWIYEVAVIRPLVIGLLVVYHALCIYTGGWSAPDGVERNEVYWWMGKLISGFRIEAIVFVAGYVFAYQYLVRGRNQEFVPMALRKIHRLIIPCVVFGFLYWVLFKFEGDWQWNLMPLRLLGGVGHLWFLPMLFWCFLIMWWLIKVVQPERRRVLGIVVLIVLCMLSVMKNPKWYLGTSQVNHFLFYFYGGYMVWVYREWIWKRLKNWWAIGTLATFYVVLLVFRLKMAIPAHWGSEAIWTLKMMHIVCGIMAMYLTVCKLLEHKSGGPSKGLIWCSGMCYGVYVFHMFLMQWLYYYTALPEMINSWLLPWVVLLLTMGGSVLLTWLFLKTKTGRWLIG